MLTRASMRLSRLRPLPWSGWLPSAGLGLLAGQWAAAALGATGTVLLVAATLATPAATVVHRSLGTALALSAGAATFGALQIQHQERAREERSAALVGKPEEIAGVVRGVKYGRGRSGSDWVALDVAVREPSASFASGERIRLSVWSTTRPWSVGEHVRVRAATRAPRGFCNDGGDGYALHAWRSGIVALAAVASDRAVTVTPREPSRLDPHAWIASARDAISRALHAAVPEQREREVLRALILGDQGDIPRNLRRAYARSGTAHVLSVSGLHIALVAVTAYVVVARTLACWPWLAVRVLVPRVAALAAIAPAAAYAALSGGAVATLRSLAMGAIGLGAVFLLRRGDVWTSLAAAALLLAVLDPGVGGEASFQLSFASVAALVVAGTHLRALWPGEAIRWRESRELVRRAAIALASAIAVSVAAGAATAPLTAYHFGSVSLVGPLANLIVVPLVGWLVLLLALGGAMLLPLSAAAGETLFVAAAACLRPANDLVAWIGGTSWAALDAALASPLQVVALLAMIAALALPQRWPRRGALAVATMLVAILVVEHAAAVMGPRLEVRFLDVGQGDASIVLLPDDSAALLVDGGGLGGSYDPGERVVVPSLWRAGVDRVRAIAMSHAQMDHYGGLAAVVRALPVDAFWWSGRGSDAKTFAALRETLAARAVADRLLALADVPLPSMHSADVRVLHPHRTLRASSANDASLVLRIVHGATRVLLTGDVESTAEATLVRRGALDATIVKVPHHGSRTSSTRGLVAATRPGVAVAMLGAKNRFGFPAREVRERYRDAGALWLQSDRDGAVTIRSDGQLETVRTCR